ncbi:MAG: HepT-like ribonuclease domain-containing protein [bacterium]
MTNLRDRHSVRDIRLACEEILDYANGHTWESFRLNSMAIAAVDWQIVVMGEASKRMSAEFQAEHPEVPWSELARTRDRIAHGYDRISLPKVWEIASELAPVLLQQMLALESLDN